MRTANNDPVKQCLIIYHIRMDTPEPQKQFELWWACHSISRLKPLIQRDSDPKCRNNIYSCIHKQQHQTLVQMFWHSFQQIVKTISTKKLNHQWNINIFIHFLTTESQGLMRFPHQYPPPRPRLSLSCTSTVAFASRSRSTTESRPLRAAKCSGVMPQQPQPEAKPQAEPNRTKGRKILRKFRAPQKSKFWKLWPLNLLPELQERCGFEMFWWHRVGWKNCCLWLFGSQDVMDNKPKHILQLRSKVRPKSLYFILFLQSKLIEV